LSKNALPQNRRPHLALGNPDLVTFFLKGSAQPAGVPVSSSTARFAARSSCGTKTNARSSSAWATRKKIEPTRSAAPLAPPSSSCSNSAATRVALDLTAMPISVAPAVEGALLASYKFEASPDAAKKSRGVLAIAGPGQGT